jgi:hypothetical protein
MNKPEPDLSVASYFQVQSNTLCKETDCGQEKSPSKHQIKYDYL